MTDVDLLPQARTNCAERYRVKGQALEAEAILAGDRDGAWAVKHEVHKLRAELGAPAPQSPSTEG